MYFVFCAVTGEPWVMGHQARKAQWCSVKRLVGVEIAIGIEIENF